MNHERGIRRGFVSVRAEGESPDIKVLVEGLNQAFASFKERHNSELSAIRSTVDELAIASAARQMNGGDEPEQASVDPTKIKALRTPKEFQAYYAKRGDASANAADAPTLREFICGVAGMKTTDAVMASLSTGTDSAGGYTVPTKLMPNILSALSPASSLLQAGAGIVPMPDGAKSVTTAGIDTIPTAQWRQELGNITESDPTFRAIQAIPKSLACIVRISRELLADGVNIEQALLGAIGQAFAKELDRVGLMGSGVAPEPLGLRNTPGVNLLPLGANGAALADFSPLLSAYGTIINADAPAPTSAIMAGRTMLDFEGLKDTTKQPMRRPRLIESMPFHTTSQIPVNQVKGTSNDTSEIYLGDFTGLYFLMREALSIQMLREAYAKTGEIGFLCHVRADVVVNYPKQFVVVQGVRPAA